MPRHVTKQSSVTELLIRWAWRFFTGAHMNGQKYNDATWWKDMSPMYRKRRSANTWWRRKARMKRLAWRNVSFFASLLFTLALVFYTSFVLFVMAGMAPILIWMGWRRGKRALFNPVVASNTDGSVTQHWVIKPKVRRFFEVFYTPKSKRLRPGLARAHELRRGVHEREIPAEYRNAVALEVADELDGQPPTELKLLMAPDDE